MSETWAWGFLVGFFTGCGFVMHSLHLLRKWRRDHEVVDIPLLPENFGVEVTITGEETDADP